MRAMKFTRAIAFATVAMTLLFSAVAVPAQAHHGKRMSSELDRVRAATAQYKVLDAATDRGYARFVDAAGIACIANPPLGAMGIHYVNGTLVGSGKINAFKPQALVYEPEEDGQLHLVALEYIAFQQPWDAKHSMAPMLFGHMFMLTKAPNRYGLPAFYSLHVWLFKHNPSGTFSMWNPNVQCETGDDE